METFQSAIEGRHAMERESGYAMWAVDVKETGTFVGQCGLQPVEPTGPEVELAYHFNKAWWNQGYGTEAAVAVLAHGLGAGSEGGNHPLAPDVQRLSGVPTRPRGTSPGRPRAG
jgi:RimJ/RimL family protein N-acetyltransferase